MSGKQYQGKPINIHLTTTIDQEGKIDNYDFNEKGLFFRIGENTYLRYAEHSDGKTFPVTLRISPKGTIRLTRTSSNYLQLHFIKGTIVKAHYKTPYGILPIETKTSLLHIDYSDSPLKGEIFINYSLYAGDQLLGKYKIRLFFDQ